MDAYLNKETTFFRRKSNNNWYLLSQISFLGPTYYTIEGNSIKL